jgi:hypothetical protein
MFRPGCLRAGACANPAPLYSVNIRRHNQGGEDCANPVHQVAPNTPAIVILDKAFQAFVSNRAKFHYA